jgi:DNA-binding beta-propeller fold protein YncE
MEMSVPASVRSGFTAAIGICLLLQGTSVQGQQRGGTPQTDKVQPVNSGANPYRIIRDWAQLALEARPWGGSNGVAIDRDGTSVWATDRCSPGTAPGCLGSKANPVHHFDASGKEIRSFGGGMFVWPHGIHVDRDGNVWVTDARAPSGDELTKFSGEDHKGSVVMKFSPDGKVLMTLGKPGVRGNPPEALTDPTDVVTDPASGDVYIAESHTDVTDPNLVGRISVFIPIWSAASRSSTRAASSSDRSERPVRAPPNSGRRMRWSSIPRAG